MDKHPNEKLKIKAFFGVLTRPQEKNLIPYPPPNRSAAVSSVLLRYFRFFFIIIYIFF